MEVALDVARWLTRRWWGKPLGWVIYAVCFAISALLLLLAAAVVVGLVGAVLYGIGLGVAHSRPLTAVLFLAALALGLVAAVLWFTAARDGATMAAAAAAVVVAVAWLVSIYARSEPVKAGTRAAFCEHHRCIGDWDSAAGHRVQCADGTWSFSGGIQGACSGHGGTGGGYVGGSGAGRRLLRRGRMTRVQDDLARTGFRLPPPALPVLAGVLLEVPAHDRVGGDGQVAPLGGDAFQ